jgi:hypothetical protein
MDALGLHAFEAGALVRRHGAFHLLADPLRWQLPGCCSTESSRFATPVRP